MINKDRENFQYRGGDLVYIISPLTSQLRTNSWKIAMKKVGPVVVYKIVDPHNYLLMTVEVDFLWNRTVDSLKTSFHPLLWTSSSLRDS